MGRAAQATAIDIRNPIAGAPTIGHDERSRSSTKSQPARPGAVARARSATADRCLRRSRRCGRTRAACACCGASVAGHVRAGHLPALLLARVLKPSRPRSRTTRPAWGLVVLAGIALGRRRHPLRRRGRRHQRPPSMAARRPGGAAAGQPVRVSRPGKTACCRRRCWGRSGVASPCPWASPSWPTPTRSGPSRTWVSASGWVPWVWPRSSRRSSRTSLR